MSREGKRRERLAIADANQFDEWAMDGVVYTTKGIKNRIGGVAVRWLITNNIERTMETFTSRCVTVSVLM